MNKMRKNQEIEFLKFLDGDPPLIFKRHSLKLPNYEKMQKNKEIEFDKVLDENPLLMFQRNLLEPPNWKKMQKKSNFSSSWTVVPP